MNGCSGAQNVKNSISDAVNIVGFTLVMKYAQIAEKLPFS